MKPNQEVLLDNDLLKNLQHKTVEAESYWIEREPPGPEPETMTRQF